MTAAARSDDESGTAHLGRVHQDASERCSVTADVMAQALGGRRCWIRLDGPLPRP